MERWEELIKNIEFPIENNIKKTYIWGAGNTAILTHQGMLRENFYQVFHVVAYIDKHHAGELLNGFPVIHPKDITEMKKDDVFILICTQNKSTYFEIKSILDVLCLSYCTLDAAIMKYRHDYILKAAALFDERSYKIYSMLLEKRLTIDSDYDNLYAGESYFGISKFCYPRQNDVVIDCGAYVGDSIERYLWRMNSFCKIIAVEPNQGNYMALCKRFSRLRLEWNLPDDKLIAIHAGVSDKCSTLFLQSKYGGLGSYSNEYKDNEETQEITCYAIDDLVQQYGLQNQVTYIKADVESFEFNVLNGARKTIANCKPRLAICIYHNIVDMYSIPLLIHLINPSYHFAVRHHSFGYEETVLYAY